MERLAGRVILLWGWRRALLALVAGALASFGHAPFDFFAICFVSFTLLVWLLDGVGDDPGKGILAGWRNAFAIGWWFGFGYFLAGLYWVGNALLVEAENFAWALPFAILVLPAILAAFYGLATTLARLLWSDGIGRIAALGMAFGAAEWLRSFLFTGFPWNAIGHTAMPIPLLMQSVTVVGTFAMSALAVFVFAMPALAASRRHRLAGSLLAVMLIAAHAGFGAWRLSQAETSPAAHLPVRIVQPSIDQGEKWDQAARDRIFAKLLDLSALPPDEGSVRSEIIVWPETSLPFLLSDRPDALTALASLLDEDQKLLAGAVRVEGTAAGRGVRYYNSILHVSAEGEIVDGYDKVHLVPFGEYLPFFETLSRLGVQQIVSSFPAFAAGARRHTLEISEGLRALPFICYEIIFPGAGEPLAGEVNLILNVTNDAWFGNSAGPYQHFRQSQIRAVELGLPLVRAANNGISAVVDAHGRVIDAFAMDVVGALDVNVPLVQSRPSRVRGDMVAFALLALLAFAMAVASLRRIDR